MKSDKMKWFSERALDYIRAAEESAQTWGHNEVGTEHLLSAFLRSPEFYPMFVERIGLNRRILMRQISGDNRPRFTAPEAPIPLSDNFKQTIAVAIKEMRKRIHSFVHPEHILMALTYFPTCIAMRLIESQRVTVSELQRQTERLFEENANIFDYQSLPKVGIQIGKSFYDGQPIRLLIQDSTTGTSLVDFTMTTQSFRDMTTRSRLGVWWGTSGEVYKNNFGDYHLTISIEESQSSHDVE